MKLFVHPSWPFLQLILGVMDAGIVEMAATFFPGYNDDMHIQIHFTDSFYLYSKLTLFSEATSPFVIEINRKLQI